jgi:hypothetical protein
MTEVQTPLYVFDFGNRKNRDKLRLAHIHSAIEVSLRDGFDMRRPAIGGIARLRPDGDLTISFGINGVEQVSTWAYADVLEAMDYLEAS